MARALVNVPAKVKRGDVVEIKVLISHPMETGFRPDPNGKFYPRDILKSFACTYDGEHVFSAELFPAVSANPFFSFTVVATQTGVLTFSWTDDKDQTQVQTAKIEVE
jgi:sulfur-oxidizing protein SoxZ